MTFSLTKTHILQWIVGHEYLFARQDKSLECALQNYSEVTSALYVV